MDDNNKPQDPNLTNNNPAVTPNPAVAPANPSALQADIDALANNSGQNTTPVASPTTPMEQPAQPVSPEPVTATPVEPLMTMPASNTPVSPLPSTPTTPTNVTPLEPVPTMTHTTGQAPFIPESEMKLPEESVAEGSSTTRSSGTGISILLIALLVFLLAILGIVIVWGEQIINLVLPDQTVELPPLPVPETNQYEVIQAELDTATNNLNNIDLNSVSASFISIENDIEVSISTTSNATETTNANQLQ